MAAKLLHFLALLFLQYEARADCGLHDEVCEFHFEIEHMMTMTHEKNLVYPYKGKLYRYDVTNTSNADPIPEDEVLIGDGWEQTRLLSVVNKQFPGPDIIVYEGQRVIVYVTNYMRSVTASIHWHGLHQVGTPWMDGVPWVTQCPIQPGQTFRYEFMAKPRGTFWWHSHSGAERTMGVFGAFIIRSRTETNVEEHIMQIQDYNHDWDSDTAHFKMEFNAIYDGRERWDGTQSLDSSFFSKFRIQSGLINGKGRYYDPETGVGNETPLTLYRVKQGQKYRFRVIGPGSLYPFRVSVDNHKLTVIASDGYDIEPEEAESFIINPGERFDFEIDANQPIGNYWVRGVTLEKEKPHIAEAVLRYDGAPDEEPMTSRQTCTGSDPCVVINCPFLYYPVNFTTCKTIDQLRALATDDPAPAYQSGRFREFFLNFAFPGIKTFPSSINGRTFRQPSVNALTQPKEWYSPCEEPACGDRKHCKCTHTISIGNGDTVQIVFTNLGSGKGWSHPVHMHGHSFYVIKMGYGDYDPVTAAIGNDTADINCRGDPEYNFCNNATWADPSWLNGNVPDVELARPPRKDTIIVPTGGYVVVRIRANNPGLWNMHCHIELHNLDGMQMLINESFSEVPNPPKGFPECHSFPPHSYRMDHILSDEPDPPQPVAEIGEWTMWSDCTTTCGPGVSFRFRTCATGFTCRQSTSESRTCQTQTCDSNTELPTASMTTMTTPQDSDDNDENIQIRVFWVVFAVLIAIIVIQLFVIVGIFCRRNADHPTLSMSGYRDSNLPGRANTAFEEKF